MQRLDVDVDISKYVAGGLVVFDLSTLDIKWIRNIHLLIFICFARSVRE